MDISSPFFINVFLNGDILIDVHSLFHIFTSGIHYCDEPEMLDENFQALIPERGLERTICDYIAGMTDRYAIEEYGKLFDPLIKP